MSRDNVQIIDRYIALVAGLTEWEVIAADDNGPRPEKPHVALRLGSARIGGVHRGSHVSDEGERVNANHHEALLQLHLIGPGGWEEGARLAVRLFEEGATETAEIDYNVAWASAPRLNNVPELVDDYTYEPRSILEVQTIYTVSVIERVGAIETVEGELSTTPGSGEPVPFIATVADITTSSDT